MRRALSLLTATVLAAGCGGNPENSAACGFASFAGASMTAQQLRVQSKWMTRATAPGDLKSVLAARVVGYGTTRVLVTRGPDGLVMGYEGDGFPKTPGFGVLLVDDSSEVVRGVLIYDKEEQEGIPRLGTISGAASTIPLYGLRVSWGSVSDPRCPLFAPLRDSTARP